MDDYRVTPGSNVKLAEIDPSETAGMTKAEAKALTKELNKRLEELQELLYAEGKHKVLVVLQAMDAGGKDGTIRKVFEHVNPQGVKVASFKKPTSEELAHDYLWRIHRHAPGTGEITIFNRSHYEDVLVVRVWDIVSEERWSKRFNHIINWEQMLADEGTTIVKFYLHIDKDEQKARLQARLDNPDKHWKFDIGDLDQRARWDDYMTAFEDVLNKTSTPDSPWFVIPANNKWYRDLVVTRIMVAALEGLAMSYPESDDLSSVVIE
jgi:PPK2 family polyphosphate:nucleotide phosphotransferase